ncbi:hypothetical protein, partial [Paenibacillus qinlingensis]|nr:hypothetical protein [Paenibacillus qinlingensis]
MSKLTPQEKIQAARRYLEGKESQDTVAQSVGISKA